MASAQTAQSRALYIRRVVVSKRHLGLGSALLDWAADVARRDYEATLIRIDVWTTNLNLHAYYEGQRFTRREEEIRGNLPTTRHRRSSNVK